ncbi:hypothetical protein GL272_22235 [Aeromonas veronii]|uniref:PcfJ domain-containing protein n=1 Tax=Aeromonas veronii TaxID=654 RepID=UPI001C5BCF95|nr:PcfJ domain-containing protein [Aeromonas veronii]MBW3779593.1 hypothetical protein [Aeromonas veronii]
MTTTFQKEISLKEVFDICVKQGVFRLFREEEDSKYKTLIICGVFRIRKNLKTNKITQQVIYYNSQGVVGWKAKRDTPCTIPLFYKGSYFVNDWIRYSIGLIINSLLSIGCVIRGGISLLDVDEFGREAFYATIKSNPHKYKNENIFLDGEVKSIKKGSFQLSLNEEVSPPQKYSFGGHEDSLKSAIVENMASRGWAFFGIKERNVAASKLSSKIWAYLDKDKCSVYFKSSFCAAIYNSNTNATLGGYLSFSRKITISNETDLGGLWPFVGLLGQRRGIPLSFSLSGKTRELYEHVSLRGVSYGDFKAMRGVKTTIISAMISIFRMRKNINRPDCRVAIKIVRHPQIKKYPVRVVLWLFDDVLRHQVPKELEKNIYTVCDKWLQYNQTLYRTIGFINARERWRTEINHLHHVIDWLEAVKPEIHKNQNWPSFWRLATAWTQQMNESQGTLDSNIPSEWEGTGIDWEDNVQELTSQVELRAEGNTMEHCIASYQEMCASGDYLAFSIKTDLGRATLGVSRFDTNSGFRLDQIRGFRNSAVSRDVEKIGREIVERINSTLNGDYDLASI